MKGWKGRGGPRFEGSEDPFAKRVVKPKVPTSPTDGGWMMECLFWTWENSDSEGTAGFIRYDYPVGTNCFFLSVSLSSLKMDGWTDTTSYENA